MGKSPPALPQLLLETDAIQVCSLFCSRRCCQPSMMPSVWNVQHLLNLCTTFPLPSFSLTRCTSRESHIIMLVATVNASKLHSYLFPPDLLLHSTLLPTLHAIGIKGQFSTPNLYIQRKYIYRDL